MTARQFLQLGEDPPGIRLELVNGEIEMSRGPNPQHSHIDSMLRHFLIAHLRDKGMGGRVLGDVDTPFGEHDVRRPDLLYFSSDRLHLVTREKLEGPPDLAVEIASPSSLKTDREVKFKLYEQGGVEHYWIIDPQERSFVGFRLVEGYYQKTAGGKDRDTVQAPPFGDLGIALGSLWGD